MLKLLKELIFHDFNLIKKISISKNNTFIQPIIKTRNMSFMTYDFIFFEHNIV